jgi:putative nucleotidyltransferase with HDIG domain
MKSRSDNAKPKRFKKAAEIQFLVVDDHPETGALLERMLIAGGLYGQTCTDGNEALTILRQGGFQVVLSDLIMPGISGMDLLETVRRKFPGVAFVMITGTNDVRQVVRAVKAGASDFLVKPVLPDELVASVRRAVEVKHLEGRPRSRCGCNLEKLVDHRTKQLGRALQLLKNTCGGTLQALGSALDLRDNETASHCHRVTRYSYELAKSMHCPAAELKQIVRGAFLHDIGKIGVPDSILRKPGPLTDEERAVMQTHVRIGYNLIRHISFLTAPAEIVLTHQERFDGTGYPQGLAGANIPLGARIFAVADTLDAMTSDRPYRRALPFLVARDEITRGSGRQFDPEVVDAFLSLPEELWQRIRDETAAAKPLSEGPSWDSLFKDL